MSTEAKWADGVSIVPQTRPAQNVEWAWANGESGKIGADVYVAAPPTTKKKKNIIIT